MEEDIIIESINNLITGFQHRYNERPRYVKMPIWAEIKLKKYARQLWTNFNYNDLEEKEEFRIFGLLVCGTIAIQQLGEMEVF